MSNKKTNNDTLIVIVMLLILLFIGIVYFYLGSDVAWFAFMILSPLVLALVLITFDNIS